MRQSDNDQLTVVGSGVTLMEAMKAAEQLAAEGVNVRVVDPFTIKPMDADTLVHCAKATGGRILTVEDHYAEGKELLISVQGPHCTGKTGKMAPLKPLSGKTQGIIINILYGQVVNFLILIIKDIAIFAAKFSNFPVD